MNDANLVGTSSDSSPRSRAPGLAITRRLIEAFEARILRLEGEIEQARQDAVYWVGGSKYSLPDMDLSEEVYERVAPEIERLDRAVTRLYARAARTQSWCEPIPGSR